MKNYFVMDETCNSGEYLIRINFNELDWIRTDETYSIVCARVCGLTYAQYLRMCRDKYGAEIRGKNSIYPTAYFKDKTKCAQLVKILNSITENLLSKRSSKNEKAKD